MSRPSRSERMAAKGRPKRQASKTHFFKYQLANNPSRAEESDLKRALQESLMEQFEGTKKRCNSSGNINIISSTNSSDVSRSNNSSFSNESAGSYVINAMAQKRTRSSAPATMSSSTPHAKRAKLNTTTNGHHQNNCRGGLPISSPKNATTTTTNKPPTPPVPRVNKAIKTYSKIKPKVDSLQQQRSFNDATTNTTRTSTNLTTVPKTATSNSTLNQDKNARLKSSNQSSVSRSTQTQNVNISKPSPASSPKKDATLTPVSKNDGNPIPELTLAPVQEQYLKFKRESKNYAYVKMTALKVSTSKSPSSNSKSATSKKASPNGISQNSNTNKDLPKVSQKADNSIGQHSNNGQSSSTKFCGSSPIILGKTGLKSDNKINSKPVNIPGKKSPINNSTKNTSHIGGKVLHNNKLPATTSVQNLQLGKNSIPRHDIHIDIDIEGPINDCSLDDDDETADLSKKKNQNQANVKVTKKRLLPGSWSLLGVPEEKVIFLRDDEPPRRLICYPAIKHVEGDVIQVRDSVLLRSGARKTDLPYIAKVCAFWEDAETGGVMMSLFWYYRPEHTEEGRKPHHLSDEIFASRHRDVDSVECIEDKCYVLTFNEYCRYRKRCKMEQVNSTWSLTDVTIPVSNESYPRRNRIPETDVNPELVFCCRQIYDSRMKRLIKNPHINPKYGHI